VTPSIIIGHHFSNQNNIRLSTVHGGRIHIIFFYRIPEEYRILQHRKEWIDQYVDMDLNGISFIYGNERIDIKEQEKIKSFLIQQWGKNGILKRMTMDDSTIKITKRRLKKWKEKYQ
jgi:hypothetical protein